MTREEILKVAKPILFNTEMVRAILDGRKTEMRRIVKPQPKLNNGFWVFGAMGWSEGIKVVYPVAGDSLYNRMPYKPGDYLYVKETWERLYCCSCEGDEIGRCFNELSGSHEGCYVYRASHYINGDARWHPSIHMPKEAARSFLRVTDVRVERLNEISIDEIAREGIRAEYMLPAFHDLWDSTIKKKDMSKYGWEANPWVWVIEFTRAEVQ